MTISELRAIALAESWRQRAACAGAPVELWFPDRGENAAAAKQVCWDECPVREECLADAIATGERFGIRGGMNPGERRAHERGTPAPQPGRPRKPIAHGQRESYGTCSRRPEGACKSCRDAHARWHNPDQRPITGSTATGYDVKPLLAARLKAVG